MKERHNTNEWVDMGSRKITTIDNDSVMRVRATFISDFEGDHRWQQPVKNEGKPNLLRDK